MRYVLFAESPEKSQEQIWLGDFDSMEDAKSYCDWLNEDTNNLPEDISPYHEVMLYDKDTRVQFYLEWDGMSQQTYFEKILENV